MATLRTRTLVDGSTTYTVLFRHNTRQTSETFDTDRGAAAFMRDIDRHGPDTARRILESRRPATGAPPRTVADQLVAHTDALSGITLGTRRKYQRIGRAIADHKIGPLPLATVTRADIAGWVRDLEAAGLSSKTIRDRQAFLSAAFVRAIDDDLMVKNPARGVRIGKTERREKVFLTHAEFLHLLAHVPAQWRPLILTLAGTGLRIGEATALQVRDLHLDNTPPTLTVSRGWEDTAGAGFILGAPKTANGRRTVGLPVEVVDALRPLCVGKPDAWVFTHDGGPVRANRLRPLWLRWIKASGIDSHPRLHDLRHAHASWMLARNYPLSDLSRRLGHASIKITADTYGHLTHDAQTRAAHIASLSLGGAYAQIGTVPAIEG